MTCKDCEYFEPDKNDPELGKCVRRDIHPQSIIHYCHNGRADDYCCLIKPKGDIDSDTKTSA